MKSNLNIQYSHGDYNYQGISFTATVDSYIGFQSYIERTTSLLTIKFSDGIRWDNVLFLTVIIILNIINQVIS